MFKSKLAVASLMFAIPAIAFAQAEKADPGSLSTKAMKDQPGNNSGGTTADPQAKPNSGSLSEKAMKDQPGNSSSSGSTANPTAKPESGSLSEKAMKDQPNAR
jgi:hypothetical protein